MSKTMKYGVIPDPGSTSTGSPLNPNQLTIPKDDDEFEIMNLGILCAVRAGDKLSLLNRVKDDTKVIQRLVDNQGNSILHIAVASGHVHIVEYIISKFPNLLRKGNLMGETALHVAARAGNLNTVEILVRFISESSYDTLISAKSKNGDTALHAALKGKHTEVAFYLVSVKHDVSFDKNNDEASPLYLAIEAENYKLVHKMLECSSCPSKIGSMLSGKSVVHAAMKANSRDILGIVLRQDPRLIELRNEEGRTCLSFGASIGFYEGIHYILAEFDKAASSTLCYVTDDDGFTPIHMAAKEGHVRIIKEFLKHCPDSRELLNSQCQNIRHVAAKTGKSKVVKYLLKLDERNRMMNEQDVDGNTPLHLATKHGHPMVVNMLTWNDGINLATLNNDGFTALDIAETIKGNSYVLHKRLTWMALVSAGAPNDLKPIPLNGSQCHIPNPEKYKDSVSALMVTATLVATVTFTAGFTLPGGYISSAPDLGMAALVNRMNFKVFILFNSIAMCSSVVTIMALSWAQLGDVLLTKKALQLALPLLVTALVSMAMAFVAGVTLVVSNLPWLSHFVLAIDTVFFVLLMLLIIPYACSSTRQGFLRHIFYFPYFLMLLVASEDSNNMDG